MNANGKTRSNLQITVDDKVRSFDFENRDLTGERACYVEGTVIGFEDWADCTRYAIKADRRVWGGKEIKDDIGHTFYPPINGTRTWLNRLTDYVELI